MKTKKLPLFLSGIIISGTLFLSHGSAVMADDTSVRNLYNDPSIQSTLQMNNQSVQWNNNARNMRVQQLRTLLREHAVIGGIAFIARYENSSYLGQLQQQVQQNTDQLTSYIGQLYGQNQQEDFRNLWTNHIDLLNQYTDARRANDGYQLQQINQQLQYAGDNIADYLARNNQSQRNNMRQMIQMHINDEKTIIDTHAAGRDSDLLNLFLQGVGHSDTMADEIIQISQRSRYNHKDY